MAMCQRAFGEHVQITSAKELRGGLYNTTYLIHMVGMPPVMVCVSPSPTRQFSLKKNLMRNEYASYPFLAPLAALLPKILMVDFTHQIIGRDYLFQTTWKANHGRRSCIRSHQQSNRCSGGNLARF